MGSAQPTAVELEGDLRRRLADAEETLRAIREGDVDALVVRGEQQDEIFALGGQDSYRAFMEAMDIGAAALDSEGKLIYANSALCSLLGRSPTELQSEGIYPALGETAARRVGELVGEAANNRRSRQVALPCARGSCHVEVAVAPLSMGFGHGHALTFTDVTERIEAAALHESDRIGRAIMASSNEAVIVVNRDGRITHANAGVRQFYEGGLIGHAFDHAFALDFPISSGLMSASDLIEVALAGTALRSIEAQFPNGQQAQDVLVGAGPLRQADDVIYGCIVTMTDVTERKAIEKRQTLLMSELTHRVRNTLTLVMSIANRTITGAKDLAEFRSSFSNRLQALAATHNLLAVGVWDALTLEELLTAELAPYVSIGSERIQLEGGNARVSADTAVALGLIFHELVTNAVKYGALSNENGTVSIRALREDYAVKIVWQELGGPVVVHPEKMGFGQTLIARGLGQGTKVEFLPEGVVCTMSVPNEKIEL